MADSLAEFYSRQPIRSANSIAIDKSMEKEDRPLEDTTIDFMPFAAAKQIEPMVAKGIRKVPSRYFDPNTYAGIKKGIKGEKPIVIDSTNAHKFTADDFATMDKINAKGSNLYGQFNPSEMKVYVGNQDYDSTLVHELQHAKDYMKGKSSGTNPEVWNDRINDAQTVKALRSSEKRLKSPEVIQGLANRIYRGNQGERAARMAEFNAKYPESKIEFIDDFAKLERDAGYSAGIKNSMTPAGIDNKRELLNKFPSHRALRNQAKTKEDYGTLIDINVPMYYTPSAIQTNKEDR